MARISKIFKRKKPEPRLKAALKKNKKELLRVLEREWEEVDTWNKRKEQREKLAKIAKESGEVLGISILVLVALASTIVVAAVAPNIFAAFGNIKGKKQHRYFNRNDFLKTSSYLKNKGLLEIKKEGPEYYIKLTSAGKEKAAEHSFKNFKITKTPSWDKIWRMVLFDVPENHKWSRDGFAKKLKDMGFCRLQKSAFVTPYPCFSEIRFLASLYNISAYVNFLETERLFNDRELRDHFDV